MTANPAGTLYVIPYGRLYDLVVARMTFLGIEEARKKLGQLVENAGRTERPEHYVLTRHGKPTADLVSHAWLEDLLDSLEELEAYRAKYGPLQRDETPRGIPNRPRLGGPRSYPPAASAE